MEPRLAVAFGIMSVVSLVGLAWGGVALHRRRRRRLRLRGIKTYGH